MQIIQHIYNLMEVAEAWFRMRLIFPL